MQKLILKVLMSDDNITREDLELSGELKEQIKNSFDNGDDIILGVLLWGTREEPKEESIIEWKVNK